MLPKRPLTILLSIVFITLIAGLGVRLVFAQLGWEEPTNTPPFDNEIPLWIKNGNDLYHTTGGNVGIGTISPSAKLHIVGGTGLNDSGIIATGKIAVYGAGSQYGVLGRDGSIAGVLGMSDAISPYASGVYGYKWGVAGGSGFAGYFLGMNGAQGLYASSICLGTTTDCKTAWSQVSGASDWSAITNKPAGFADNTDNDTTYSAGSGISISNNTITNTGDLSDTNELQTLQSVINRGATANTTSNPMYLSYQSNNSAYNDNALRISYENSNSGSTKSALRIDNYSQGYTFFAGDTVNDSTPFVINNIGRVGIGTTSPAEKLHINGNVQADAFLYASDKNLKTDIQPLFSKDALEKILNLQGVSFKWKKDGTSSIGVIAQDLEKVVPELVSTDPNTELKSVQYANLAALLIEAVKEQQQQIKRLEAEIEELKK